ncbi:hypothetical protein ABZU75_35880 [Streptosporangium sp. NPDC005286]
MPFIDLPVKDLAISRRFFTEPGFAVSDRFAGHLRETAHMNFSTAQ